MSDCIHQRTYQKVPRIIWTLTDVAYNPGVRDPPISRPFQGCQLSYIPYVFLLLLITDLLVTTAQLWNKVRCTMVGVRSGYAHSIAF